MQPIALCYGTRPQVIKASVLRRELSRRWPTVAVDTGQHYDYALNQLLYEQLDVAPPDHFLEVGSAGHAAQTAAILIRMEALLQRVNPSAVVVIGDTNSTLGSALAAGKANVPVAHVEAGLRADDARMAEEINRKLVDAIATLLLAPGESSAARLRATRRDASVVNTGDVALDVLRRTESRIPPVSRVLPSGFSSPFVFATLHRAELTAHPGILIEVLEALGRLGMPVILALHPRTRAALAQTGERRERIGGLSIVAPLGYLESLSMIRSAILVATDSGGIQREAYWLGVPCITIRQETEWTETLKLGANRLVPPASAQQDLPDAVRRLLDTWKQGTTWKKDEYGTGDAAPRIADAIGTWLEPK